MRGPARGGLRPRMRRTMRRLRRQEIRLLAQLHGRRAGRLVELAWPRSAHYDSGMAQDGPRDSLKRWALIGLGAAVFAAQAKQARDVYVEEIPAGGKPIEGVGTAVAAFVGVSSPRRNPMRWGLIGLGVILFAARAKQARDVYVDEMPAGSKPIEGVGTAVAAFVGLLPGGPLNQPPQSPKK